MHKKPALHNAMWPGLVGKGGPDAEPPIDLDTMLDLTAKARVGRQPKFDGVDLFLFDPHVSIDSTDDDLQRLADKIRAKRPRRRLAGRAGVAADRRRLGDGQRRRAEGVPDAGAQGVRDRPEAAQTSASAATASSASTRRRARRSGRRIPPATRRRSPTRSGRRPTSPRIPASGSPPKGRSAGAACTA